MVAIELEKQLRAPQLEMAPYPPKAITLATGEILVVREARKDEAATLLETVYPLIGVARDYYDIVAARMYSEILGWVRDRTANEFVLVGAINGVIGGIVTSRMKDRQVGISLHTLTVKRGLRIGAQLFAAKMEHHIEYLGQEEVYIVAESPIGFRRWMIEYGLEDLSDQYPAIQHELGGIPTYSLTRELYYEVKGEKVFGERPIDPKALATADTLVVPDEYPQIPDFKRRAS